MVNTLFFVFLMALLIVQLKRVTGNRERGGSDTQQSDPGWESNPGLLLSLSTWDAHSTN